jgi:hypothetical protein
VGLISLLYRSASLSYYYVMQNEMKNRMPYVRKKHSDYYLAATPPAGHECGEEHYPVRA